MAHVRNGAYVRQLLGAVVAIVTIHGALCRGSSTNMQSLYTDVIKSHDKHVPPVEYGHLTVTVNMYLDAILEVNEGQGTFSFTGSLKLNWTDAMKQWDPDKYGGITHFVARYEDMWVPDIVLDNSATESITFGKPWQTVDLFYDGTAIWNRGGLIKTTCTYDVRFFPFDKHVCTVNLTALGQTQIVAAANKIDTRRYSWVISGFKILRTDARSPEYFDRPGVVFGMRIVRHADFIWCNIFLPTYTLNLLNLFVFFIKPDTGDRVSFCMTLLLAKTIFVNMISNLLPNTMPVVAYFLAIDFVIGSFLAFITIVFLRWYHMGDGIEVPGYMIALYRCWPSKYCLSNESETTRELERSNAIRLSSLETPTEQTAVNQQPSSRKRITWKNICSKLDGMLLFIFAIIYFLPFVVLWFSLYYLGYEV